MKPTKENITSLYGLDSKTPVQIRAMLKETVSVNTTSVIDGKEVIKPRLFPKIGGLETRAIIGKVLAEKQKATDDALKVAEFVAKYSVWVSLGKPVSMLVRNQEGDLLGFDMSAKVEGF